MYIINIKEEFCAAHAVYCNNELETLHGHNWLIELKIMGKELDQNGMLIDFYEIKKMLQSVLQKLDHQNLCCLDYFKHSTTECIAEWIYVQLEKLLEIYKIKVQEVTVWETNDCSVTYQKKEELC